LQPAKSRGQDREIGLAAEVWKIGFEPAAHEASEEMSGSFSSKNHKFHNCACNLLKGLLMTVTEVPIQSGLVADRPGEDPADGATCYSVTIFTNRWKEMRDFYVEILSAEVVSERADRYCEMKIGGVPLCLRRSECGEMVSYFHLYLTLKNREPVLHELRKRGIIVTNVGPYTNFRDPEGRVIKISDSTTVVG
jgi:hypothetical protein